MCKRKRVMAVLLAAIMVISTVLVGKFTIADAASNNDKAFSMSNFRLNNSTANTVEYGTSTPISLGIQITNEDKGKANPEDFKGKFYFYYYRQGQDKVADSILLNPEGFSAASCTDELKEQYGITEASGIKNGRLVAFCKTTIDTTPYRLTDVLLFWVKYVPGTDDYYSEETVINNNIGKDKAINLVASTTVNLELDNVSDIEYGDTVKLNAEVSSIYEGTQIDPLSGKVTFVITGADGTTYTHVGYTSKDTGGKCQIDVPDRLAAGSYTVTATYEHSSGNAKGSTASKDFNVIKKPIKISPYPSTLQIQKNDEIPDYFTGYEVKDKDDNTADEVYLKNVKFVTDITDTSIVGTKGKIYVSDAQKAIIEADNPNYTITYGEGELEVVTSRVNEAPVIDLLPHITVPSKKVEVTFRISDDYTHNDDLVVTVKDSDNNVINVTRDGSGNCSFVSQENTSYTITVSDEDTEVGKQESSAVVVVDNIDILNPSCEITKNTEEPTKESVTITLNPSDEVSEGAKEGIGGVASVVVQDDSGERVTLLKNTFTAADNGSYTVVVTDKAGNQYTDTITVDNIDNEPPVCEINKSTEEPVKESVTVTLNPSDEVSEGAKEGIGGIASVVVKDAKGNEVTLVNNTFTAADNGSYTVVVTDKAGNQHTDTITVDNIDNEPPVCEINKSTEEPVKESVTVTLNPSDEVSEGAKEGIGGIASVVVTDANGNEVTLVNNTFTAADNGKYTVVVTDKAGNQHTDTITVDNIDNKPPVCVIKKSTEEPVKGSVTVTLTPSDEVSEGAKEGISGIESVVVTDAKGNEVTLVNNTFTAADNGSYTVIVTDKAGNQHTDTITVDNIDNKPPVCVIKKSTEEPVKGSVTVTLTPSDDAGEGARDGISGIESVVVTDGMENPVPVKDNKFVADKNGTYKIVVKDKVGNEIRETITINNIITETPSEPEKPSEPQTSGTEPTEPVQGSESETVAPAAPSTGDSSPFMFYIIMIVGALLTIGAGFITLKKKEER